jgi:hypothetical protein
MNVIAYRIKDFVACFDYETGTGTMVNTGHMLGLSLLDYNVERATVP